MFACSPFLPEYLSSSLKSKSGGFTIVELITTIVIVGILGSVAIPKLVDTQDFTTIGFRDEVRSALSYARASALAKRRTVCVGVTSSTVAFTTSTNFGGACDANSALPAPATGNALVLNVPSGMTLTSTQNGFSFDAKGSASSQVAISLILGATLTITVEKESGYVH